jgi:hypothetical protein
MSFSSRWTSASLFRSSHGQSPQLRIRDLSLPAALQKLLQDDGTIPLLVAGGINERDRFLLRHEFEKR